MFARVVVAFAAPRLFACGDAASTGSETGLRELVLEPGRMLTGRSSGWLESGGPVRAAFDCEGSGDDFTVRGEPIE